MSGTERPRGLGEMRADRSWASGTLALTSALEEFELGNDISLLDISSVS